MCQCISVCMYVCINIYIYIKVFYDESNFIAFNVCCHSINYS